LKEATLTTGCLRLFGLGLLGVGLIVTSLIVALL
jgi:uncharacterized protein YjeT (DUF2065 family)